ncbi:MAG: DegV family protein, partial [Lachnospiraceae bacterium]|nr:DegV family protein [Lachnospiraceae bacterium]
PTTFHNSSMPSVQEYIEVFTPIVSEGIAVIFICITTKFSGSYQSAMNAREMVLESCPNARITVMDSTINTVLQGIFVLEAVRMYEARLPYEKVVEALEAIKGTGRIFFTVGNIDYLKHGGRIGKLAGIAGSMLGIRPLITLKEGEIFPSGLARSRKKSLEKVYDLLWQYLQEIHAVPGAYSICVGYGYDIEEGEAFRKGAVEFLNAKGYAVTDAEIDKYQIGATISVHTGPYPLGFGVIRKSMV